ncbi:MAG TPA: hypothetical protein VN963_01300 [bacterium]|jgi:hypothetical protein|nr:hypothetical protein [bacterium]
MKKIAFLVLIFVFGTTFAFADDGDGDESNTKKTSNSSDSFFLGFGGGTDLPGTNWSSNYTIGGGAQVFGGYSFDKNWALTLDVENWFFEGSGFSLYNLRTLASVKYAFSLEGWQPYLLAGAGLVYQGLSTGASASNLDALGGLGVQFDLTADTHFFVEAKYNFILPSAGSFQDVPISTGLWVGLP